MSFSDRQYKEMHFVYWLECAVIEHHAGYDFCHNLQGMNDNNTLDMKIGTLPSLIQHVDTPIPHDNTNTKNDIIPGCYFKKNPFRYFNMSRKGTFSLDL